MQEKKIFSEKTLFWNEWGNKEKFKKRTPSDRNKNQWTKNEKRNKNNLKKKQ